MMQLLGKLPNTDIYEVLSNIDITFTRNVVNIVSEQLDNAIKASSIISKRSMLSMLDGIIDDVDEEMQRLDEEREANISFMQDYTDNDFNNTDEEDTDMQEEEVDNSKEDDK